MHKLYLFFKRYTFSSIITKLIELASSISELFLRIKLKSSYIKVTMYARPFVGRPQSKSKPSLQVWADWLRFSDLLKRQGRLLQLNQSIDQPTMSHLYKLKPRIKLHHFIFPRKVHIKGFVNLNFQGIKNIKKMQSNLN